MKDWGSVAVINAAKYLDDKDRLCFHNCLFCMEQMEPGCSSEQLPSLENIDTAINHYRETHGEISKLYIAGGEPTLRKDFSELIELVKQYCQTIILSTNCDYPTEDETIQKILDAGIKNIATSVHGALSTTHDYLTCKAGSFFQTMSAMEKLILEGMDVTVNTVVNAFNVHEMSDIVLMFQKKKLGIKKLTLTHYMHHGNAYYHNNLWFNVDDCTDVLAESINASHYVSYKVAFRDFPLCLNRFLATHQEVVKHINIIGFHPKNMYIKGEKAPSFIKDKCWGCTLFDACPKYLTANYRERIEYAGTD